MNVQKNMRSEISAYCKKLSFSQTAVSLCESGASAKEIEFLHTVFEKEIENREMSRKARFLKSAGFPVYKTLDNYDFKSLKLTGGLTKESFINPIFIKEKKNLVLFGKVGTGKTHLATGIGVRACEMDMPVRFYTVSELVFKLSEGVRNGSLEKLLSSILKSDLIILDEWGYVPLDKHGAQLLYRVISDSYERRSLIITTNLEFSKWGSVINDDQMAAAMIDRLAHHGHLLVFEGESYRMKNALMKKK